MNKITRKALIGLGLLGALAASAASAKVSGTVNYSTKSVTLVDTGVTPSGQTLMANLYYLSTSASSIDVTPSSNTNAFDSSITNTCFNFNNPNQTANFTMTRTNVTGQTAGDFSLGCSGVTGKLGTATGWIDDL
jgi:hypothetical protein